MQAALPLVLVMVLAASARAAEPEAAPEAEALDRFGIGVTASAGASLWGFPMVGPGFGLAARVRIVDGVSVEPHVDGLVESFVLVGVMSAQAAVPVVFEYAMDNGPRTHVGLGPWLATATLFGHEGADLGTFVGGEVVGGVGFPLNDFLEARAQLRAHVGFGPPGARVPLTVGGAGTVGLLLTF